MNNKPLRFGIVAGEASGDLLGANLISAIKQRHPDSIFEGIAGPSMIEQGAESLYPMDRLSVMGIFEVLGRYRELLGIRNNLYHHFKQNPPDVFIGIDAPDFNLGLEGKLRAHGISTVHYVSPSVWAWRQHRVRKIAKSTNLMLTLFPFEEEFYKNHNVPVRFVGHPLADIIPLVSDKLKSRQALSLPQDGKILALLPGSRSNEMQYLGKPFLETVVWLRERIPGLEVVVPVTNNIRREQLQHIIDTFPDGLSIKIVDRRSRDVMSAADVVLLASGTAALEAMLLKRPMVAAYKLSPLTYWILKMLVKVNNVTIPNLLANEVLVPEFIQQEATPANMGQAVLNYLQNQDVVNKLQQRFYDMHKLLQQDASKNAADAILELISE